MHNTTFPTDPFCCLVGTEPDSTLDLCDRTRRGCKICDAPAKPLNLHRSFLLFPKSTLKTIKMFAVPGLSCLNNQIHLYVNCSLFCMYYTCIATSGAESQWKISQCWCSVMCVYCTRALTRVCCLCAWRHLGGEVPVEDALAVQVLQSPGDVQGQAEPHAPRQVHVAAQQLLQVTAVDVLDDRDKRQQRGVHQEEFTGCWYESCFTYCFGKLGPKCLTEAV